MPGHYLGTSLRAQSSGGMSLTILASRDSFPQVIGICFIHFLTHMRT